jgi:membrane fusion protein, multidrug efflux system
VQTGQESLLATVQQVDPIYVTFSVSEQEILHWQEMIRAGVVTVPEQNQIPLALELVNGTRYPQTGHLNFLGVQIEAGTGTSLTRGQFPNPDSTLRPGQFVRVIVEGIQRVNTIVVPQRAVMLRPTGASVFVITPGNTAQLRPVQLGEWAGTGWIVESGLAAGERVATDMLMRLQPGTGVTAVSETSPPPTGPPPQTTPAPGSVAPAPPSGNPSTTQEPPAR